MMPGSKDFRNGDQLAISVLEISDVDGVIQQSSQNR
jgi:hypothetical protein